MSNYYKYNFTSPESVYTIIKEELKSFFDTGSIDDMLFPTYTEKCLKKLGKGSYVIKEEALIVEDFETRLPDNFEAAREVWLCTSIPMRSYQSASSFYSQSFSQTIQISDVIVNGECYTPPCEDECNNECEDECEIETFPAVYKTNNVIERSFKKQYLLKPGNISVRSNCSLDCANFGSNASDSFDIRDNKLVTNFRNGTIYLVYYTIDVDCEGNQLIPDNYRIKEYIEAFIKYKMFETLTNQTNDETFNQLQQKLVYYKQLSDEAFIMADIETKKQTVWQKQAAIRRDNERLNRYDIYHNNNNRIVRGTRGRYYGR